MRLHLHLVSDSTGETLESVAKAGLAQFEDVETIKHFWPLVRSRGHLDRVLMDIASRPGLVLFTLVNADMRTHLEARCRAMGLPAVGVLDPVIEGLQAVLGQRAAARPGRQHQMDEAYFRRVAAIDYTMNHDDGQGADNWEEADILLIGVSRTSKTPTSIYLANRGYKTANLPLVPTSRPPEQLFRLSKPMVVGLTTNPDRLVQVRRNRLLSLAQAPETAYVDMDEVTKEVAAARRLCADNSWPVIDVSRRSIEESAAAIINLYNERAEARANGSAA
ncbi:pyruvate, water dikinase regulatory protein [uncultured Sphingosinicella sp.]|jgi:[pyruvate, water dikinase]-phosphate phosphotransferase / [pyruvate, water dikinase] kinase|uniref:pyruvate, water dikinase regulatory protein n=1 Tax=uncultured Sphingosinicella sp. TaxID=478748 RepID=UPI0030D9F840|tara:strand:+ start:540 stop:1370 length:831 start_codon:yes stop_codon:yes gene_type:complete